MKILHICICGEFYEKYAYQDNLLPKYHKKAGHEVTIIASTRCRFDPKTGKIIQDRTKCKFLDDGIKVLRVASIIPLCINKHIHFYGGVSRLIKDEKPDVVFVHGVESPNYLYLVKYKKDHPNVKIVYDNHTDLVNSQHSIISKWWAKHIIRDVIVKHLVLTSDHFYGTTPIRCDFLIDFYNVPKEKVIFLPMGADDDSMHYDLKQQLRNEIRRQYSVRDDEFLIVTGGKINRKKNIHSLVKAVNNVRLNVKVLVFGSVVDEMKGILDSMKTDKTIYVGWVPSNEVYKYFYAADLVFFPGLHSVLWEQAVACKVPTAFSKISGFEHVNFNENAILLENNTPHYYECEISKLLSTPELYEKLKANSSGEKAEMFLYSRIAQKVLDDILQY